METPVDGTSGGGVERIAVENQHLRIEILPACGGKLATLTSCASGRQWLWQNPYLAHRVPAYGASYVAELDSGGWDEIFPSIDPCALPLDDGASMEVPDHGDLVCMGSRVERIDDTTLVTRWEGRCTPFLFTRTLRLDGPELQMQYQVENTGTNAFPWLGCPHPLMQVEPGMRIELPAGTPFSIQAVEGEAPVRRGDRIAWPGTPDLSTMPDPGADGVKPFAIKLFSEPGAVSRVGWRAPDRSEAVILEWDAEDLPYLGFWMNLGGWSGSGSPHYYNLGIEPATAPCDDLGEAQRRGWARTLAVGESHTYAVTLRLVGAES